MRSKTGYAEFGYFHCYLKMDAPRALVFRPLVKGNEALGTRLNRHLKPSNLVECARTVMTLTQNLAVSNRPTGGIRIQWLSRQME